MPFPLSFCSNVCFAEHFFRKTAAIMTELCWSTDVNAEDYRLGKSMIFINPKAMNAMRGIVHDMLDNVAGRIQRW